MISRDIVQIVKVVTLTLEILWIYFSHYRLYKFYLFFIIKNWMDGNAMALWSWSIYKCMVYGLKLFQEKDATLFYCLSHSWTHNSQATRAIGFTFVFVLLNHLCLWKFGFNTKLWISVAPRTLCSNAHHHHHQTLIFFLFRFQCFLHAIDTTLKIWGGWNETTYHCEIFCFIFIFNTNIILFNFYKQTINK